MTGFIIRRQIAGLSISHAQPSRIQPGCEPLRFLLQELQADTQTAILGEERMKAFTIDAVAVLAVAARGDRPAFSQGPAHPAKSGGAKQFIVEKRGGGDGLDLREQSRAVAGAQRDVRGAS